MQTTISRHPVLLALMLLAAFALSFCSQSTTSSKFTAADLYPIETAEEYATAGNEGYGQAEDGDIDTAIATFKRQEQIIPDGTWAPYNEACMYARQGNLDQAFAALDRAVANGWDSRTHLETDTDMDPLREDHRFTTVLEKVDATRENAEQFMADGMPRYDTPPVTFPEEEQLDEWYNEQRRLLRANSRVLPEWKINAAQLDIEAQHVAAMNHLMGDEYDEDFQRIVALTGIRSIYEEEWGSLCDAIDKEVTDYLDKHPNSDNVDEVRYRGGMAALMRCGVFGTSKTEWAGKVEHARGYLESVSKESDFYGASQALLLAARIARARQNDTTDDILHDVKAFESAYGEDRTAQRVGRVFFARELVKASWPIAVQGVDVNGKAISLDDYRGKVVLLDFWATWCGPCRVELPHVKDAYAKYRKDGFDILSVSLDFSDRLSTEDYKEWITEAGMSWRHIYEGNGWDDRHVADYFVSGIPAAFLIGRNGELLAMGEDLRGENLNASIEKALYSQAH